MKAAIALAFLSVAVNGCDQTTAQPAVASVSQNGNPPPPPGYQLLDKAQPPTAEEAYTLQERCAKSAEAFFLKKGHKEGHYTSDGYGFSDSYTVHYNLRMNSCLMLTSSTKIPQKDGLNSMSDDVLFDVLGNRIIGEHTVMWSVENPNKVAAETCLVEAKICADQMQWNERTKPYLTE